MLVVGRSPLGDAGLGLRLLPGRRQAQRPALGTHRSAGAPATAQAEYGAHTGRISVVYPR